jgi:hypothetical protein
MILWTCQCNAGAVAVTGNLHLCSLAARHQWHYVFNAAVAALNAEPDMAPHRSITAAASRRGQGGGFTSEVVGAACRFPGGVTGLHCDQCPFSCTSTQMLPAAAVARPWKKGANHCLDTTVHKLLPDAGLEELHHAASGCQDLQRAVPLDRWDIDAWCALCNPCKSHHLYMTFKSPS